VTRYKSFPLLFQCANGAVLVEVGNMIQNIAFYTIVNDIEIGGISIITYNHRINGTEGVLSDIQNFA